VHEPHAPIASDPRFSGLYPGNPNSEYLGNVTQLDHALGMFMDALDAKGLASNTLLIFTSDNGPEGQGGVKGGSTGGLRGRKRSDYEGGIRVPGIVRWPGHIKAGTVSDVPVIGTDIFATVLDVTGVALPKDRTIDGVSMRPAFAGRPVERKNPLFWRTHVSPPGDRVAMRIGDWKLVGNDQMTSFELYEIQKDWKEENNLAGKMPAKVREMREAMLELWREIEAEGPKEWWRSDPRAKKKAEGLTY
jgi:arylsulfatase A-like enzyme